MSEREILICAGTGCLSLGAEDIKNKLIEELEIKGLAEKYPVKDVIKMTGCIGTCDLGPVMIIRPENTFYVHISVEDVEKIVEEHLIKGNIVESLLSENDDQHKVEDYREVDFMKRQVRIALRNTGLIDPLNIDDYINRDGYRALEKVLKEMTTIEVINEIKASGLRGRGGAGFPTGQKWEFSCQVENKQKYVVCNADEGDPGAFMDRSILEGDPHSIIEAMAIAGYAIGANQGYVYVRAEYPLAIKNLKQAIADAEEGSYLGENIFNTDFSFNLEIRVGAGAFVCGEETALLASIEGKRGNPRPKPPYPAVSGLWGKPTVINNVETLANIVPIILKGAIWFSSIGTENSKGTKVFAVAGNVRRTGLVEVPFGTTLGEIIFDIAGGIPDGKKFKAVQMGGPSGGAIPSKYLNLEIDYENLKKIGAMVGSGGLIVMDEDSCMVDVARFFLDFAQEESCGKCIPCRIGTKRMLEILERITRGEGQDGDIEKLEELGNTIKETSLCGLGQTAPNPVLSTIKFFREEYEAHIYKKECPASVCAALFTSPCINACPAHVDVPRYIEAIHARNYKKAVEIIKEKNPFPAICGRVCHHPCENKCLRGDMDEPLSIRELKRFAADYVLDNGIDVTPPKQSKDTEIAVVGSGPMGLTAAYYLAVLGHKVTVFEKLPVPGGMMAVGIPDYRLSKKYLKQEIDELLKLGIEFKTGITVGKDISWNKLKEDYAAVVVGIGAHKHLNMNIPGEKEPGVYSGLELLREISLDHKPEIGDRVIVIGGGNVAMDAARSALRLGADDVSIYYRRGREEMPALEEEIEAALAENIKLVQFVNPVEIINEGDSLKVRYQKMVADGFGEDGRRRFTTSKDEPESVRVNNVIIAIGQKIEDEFLNQEVGDLLEKGRIKTGNDITMTNIQGFFAGGDCVTGAATVIDAIAAGYKVADEIDKYLGGNGIVEPEVKRELGHELIEEEMPRCQPEELSPEERANSFAEVVKVLPEEIAVKEAGRCMRCDIEELDEEGGYQENVD